MFKGILLLLFCFITVGCFAQTKFKSYKLKKHIAVNDSYEWDYAVADENSRHLFVSHGVKVLVIDMDKDEVIGEIDNTLGAHGIALATNQNRGFISNGKANSVTVFDLQTLKMIDTVAIMGQNPDAILYDEYSNMVFTFNGKSKDATVIDASALRIITTIPLYGKPEFAVADGSGNIFVNIEDKSTITHINSKELMVKKQWLILPGVEPSGLAIDLKNNLLFSVCDNSTLVVFDYAAGKVQTTLAIGKGVDAVVFDAASQLIYSSNGEGTVSIFHQDSKEKYTAVQTLTTQKGCRTIAQDKLTKKIYLSAGKYEEGKRTLVTGSFEVLVYGNK